MLTAVLIAFVGLVLAIVLGRLLLSGILATAFRRARSLVRRVLTRRVAERPGSDRRQGERRD